MAVIIRPNGDMTEIMPQNHKEFTLQELKIAIGGGYIEVIHLQRDMFMVCDEDFLAKGLPLNVIATALVNSVGRNDIICGQVLVCSKSQMGDD
jgi:Domain of unknown function (DUF3846)